MKALYAFRERHGLTGETGGQVAKSAGRLDLCALFAALGYTRGAEVGVWEGGFSERICQAVPGVQLTCVDPWAPYADYREKKNDPVRLDAAYRATCDRLRPYGCTVVRATSTAAAQQIPDRSLDFVYIDANHEEAYVRQDLEAWVPKIRVGGIVAGHDYQVVPPAKPKPFIQVKPAVDAFTVARRIAPWFVLARDKSPSFFWVVS